MPQGGCVPPKDGWFLGEPRGRGCCWCSLGSGGGWHRTSCRRGWVQQEHGGLPRPELPRQPRAVFAHRSRPAALRLSRLFAGLLVTALAISHRRRNSQANTAIDFLSNSLPMDLPTNGIAFQQVVKGQPVPVGVRWP